MSQNSFASKCPESMRRNIERYANYRCLMAVPFLEGHRRFLPLDGLVFPLAHGHRQRLIAAHQHREVRDFIAQCTCIWACQATGPLEIDHVFPRKDGGTYTYLNNAPLCPRCNKMRIGQRSLIDYRVFYPEFMQAMHRLFEEEHAQMELLFAQSSQRAVPSTQWTPYRQVPYGQMIKIGQHR